MKLNSVEISNFRSIKYAKIVFDENLQILIGKNEAGKSNVLKAIAAVFGACEVTKKDRRKRIGNERIDESDYYVRAMFDLSEDEDKDFVDEIINAIADTQGSPFKEDFGRELLKLIRQIPIEVTVSDGEMPGPSVRITKQLIPDNLHDLFYSSFGQYVSKYYRCHYRKPDMSDVIPSEVDLDVFRNDPNSCPPLLDLFTLGNRNNVSTEIDNAEDGDGDLINLLKSISDSATKRFRSVWNGFDEVCVVLHSDRPFVRIKFEEAGAYNFEDRSDGFKKLVSLLLLFSSRETSESAGQKNLILIDEPDNSLYPGSARALRDELKKLGDSTTIVYATHSQFMLDDENIERHLIVQKENEITTVERADQKNNVGLLDDELLRRVIGTSIFEHLKAKNLLFEGRTDRLFFEMYRKLTEDRFFEDFGTVYLHGIKDSFCISQMLMLAEKQFAIIADSDQTSMSRKREFQDHYEEIKDNWLDYKTYSKDRTVTNLEDFFQEDYAKREFEALGVTFEENKSVSANVKNQRGSGNSDSEKALKRKLIESFDDLGQICTESYKTFFDAIVEHFSKK